jgi:hypothetical protein
VRWISGKTYKAWAIGANTERNTEWPTAIQTRRASCRGNPSGRPRTKPISDRYAYVAEEKLPENIRKKLGLAAGTTYGDALSLSCYGSNSRLFGPNKRLFGWLLRESRIFFSRVFTFRRAYGWTRHEILKNRGPIGISLTLKLLSAVFSKPVAFGRWPALWSKHCDQHAGRAHWCL